MYSGLIERLEKLKGRDRDLDNEIWRLVMADQPSLIDHSHAPMLTASLDAIISLVPKVLPGWLIARIGQDDSGAWHAELRSRSASFYSTVALPGRDTPAIALLLAMMKALASKEKEADV